MAKNGDWLLLCHSQRFSSQEWLTTAAACWTFIAAPKDGVNEILAYTSSRGDPKTLGMKNGLPYLSKELFWKAMEDITAATTLVSGHSWPELREMIHEQVQQARPQTFAVQDVVLTPYPPVELSYLGKSVNFRPHQVRQEIIRLFEENQPRPNANRWGLSGVAKSLTFGRSTDW